MAQIQNLLRERGLPAMVLQPRWTQKADETLQKWPKALNRRESQADDSDSNDEEDSNNDEKEGNDSDGKEDTSRAKPPMKAILDRMIGLS